LQICNKLKQIIPSAFTLYSFNMIFIVPNGQNFHSNSHPCGVDAATVPKTPCPRAAGAAAHSACPRRSDAARRAAWAARFGLLQHLDAAPTKAQPEANTSNLRGDSKVVVEKSPLHRHETSEKTTISLDVAGFEPEYLKVEIEDHVLMVAAERTNKLGDTFMTRRRLALKADVYDEDSVHADLEDGVLEITIQKKMVSKSRHVPINVTLPSSSSKQKNNKTEVAAADAVPNTMNAPQSGYSEEMNSMEDEVATAATTTLVEQSDESSDGVEVVSVETVEEKEENNVEEADEAPSTTQSHEDTWEEVVQA
jgi:HSP20 family molecular chaperone IbpA